MKGLRNVSIFICLIFLTVFSLSLVKTSTPSAAGGQREASQMWPDNFAQRRRIQRNDAKRDRRKPNIGGIQ